MRRRATLRWAGYAGFTLLSLAVGMTLTSPAEAVGQRLAHELQRASGGGWTMTYREATPWRLSGIALTEVRLQTSPAAGEPTLLPLQAVRLRLRLLPLLLGRLGVSGELVGGGGRLAATVAQGRERSLQVEVAADNLDLANPPWLAPLVGLPVGGRLGGRGELAWEGELRRCTGQLQARIGGLQIGPGAVAGVVLPTIAFGDVAWASELKDGRLSVPELRQEGGNLRLRGSLGVQLRQPFSLSTLQACTMLRAEPAFLASNPKIRSALQLAEMQLKRDAEGFLHLPLAGTLGAPKVAGGLCR